jgi:prepilin-type N-terminal cleavage/methylation domain-containing protein
MNRNGFSILELLVVIAVASIVVGIGLPAINNFGVSENYQGDISIVRSQFNLVRQMAMEDGNAYRIKIVNNDSDNTAELEVYKDESLNRFNTEFHKSSSPPCSSFSGVGNNGAKVDDLTKELEHFVIKKCTSLTGNCTAVSNANNYFCILPNATMPENARGSITASNRAGGKSDFLNVYSSGFFNIGSRID